MAVSATYYQNVFINCPFDPEYLPLFQALIFVITACGFIPRCALEAEDSGDVRIQKIKAIIGECCYGVHDISRTELSRIERPGDTWEFLPRFNMPLELGLFMGAQHFGTGVQRKKNYLVFDVEKGRYQRFISDLAGQDIKIHGWPGSGWPLPDREKAIGNLITAVRNWLNPKVGDLPGGPRIGSRYRQFKKLLPTLAEAFEESEQDLTFYDLCALTQKWIASNPA